MIFSLFFSIRSVYGQGTMAADTAAADVQAQLPGKKGERQMTRFAQNAKSIMTAALLNPWPGHNVTCAMGRSYQGRPISGKPDPEHPAHATLKG
jgi:hypothetical protein